MEEGKNGQGAHGEHQHEHGSASKSWYDKYYKIILVLPALLLLLSVVYLFNFYRAESDVIYKDVSLTGGTTITVFDASADANELKQELKNEFPDLVTRVISDIRTGKQEGFSVEVRAEADVIKKAVEKYLGYELNSENSSVEFSGSSLSQGFYAQLRLAILIAFALMAAVVFFIFRTFVQSLAVILAAFADIVMAIAVVDISGMQLSGAGIVAFLMLIGYSVDTDILLTTRLLRSREGNVNERIFGAFKTGMTMTLTAIAAVGVSLAVIYNFSDTLRQMFTIILIGLGFDIMNTWVTNASMLKWYMEVRKIE